MSPRGEGAKWLKWETIVAGGSLFLALLGMYGAFAVLPVKIDHLRKDVDKLESKVESANQERQEMAETLARIDQRLASIDDSLRELKRQ